MIQPVLLVVTLAFAAAPFITAPFMGYDPGIFPVRIERPSVQPAGYAFAIWGLIYVWLILHAAFGIIKRRDDPAFTKPALPLAIAVALGTVWLAIALAAPIPATLVIIGMSGLANYAFLIADPDQDRWLLSAPLAVFASWLTAAAAVSSGVILAGYGVLSDTDTAIVMLIIVLLIAIGVQLGRPRTPIYGATVIWAIAGIVMANWGVNPVVAYAAIGGAIGMAVAILRR